MADDSSIKGWSETPNDNGPLGSDVIGAGLDDQLRNIKAIVRQESLNKQWIRYGYQVQRIDDTHFRMYGDLGGQEGSSKLLQKNRKVLMEGPSGVTAVATITAQESETISGVVWTKCTVAPDVYGGVVPTGLTEVKVGAITDLNGALPGSVLTTTNNQMFGTAALTETSGTTLSFTATLSDFVGTLTPGQVFYVTFPVANQGATLLKINNSGFVEIKKVAQFSAVNMPIAAAALQGLDSGDLAANQIATLVYQNVNNQGIFQLVSPPAMTTTLGDLARVLFTLNTNTYDGTSCTDGGYIKLMKNTALVWCITKPVDAATGTSPSITPGSLSVPLPLAAGYSGNSATVGAIEKVYGIATAKVKATNFSSSAFVVSFNNYGVVTVQNPGDKTENLSIMAVVKLGYSI